MNRQEILACLAQADLIYSLATRQDKELPELAESVDKVVRTLLDALNVTYA